MANKKTVSPAVAAPVASASAGVVKLSASDLFAPVELTRLEIPELSRDGQLGVIYLRTLTAGDVVPLITAANEDGSTGVTADFQHKLIALAAVDEDGNPLFAGPEDVKKVRLSIYNRMSSALAGVELPEVLGGKALKPAGEGSPIA